MILEENLSQSIYNAYINEGVGKDFFAKFAAEVAEVNAIEFLVANFKTFDDKYNLELMLCLPQIWDSFQIDDWLELMKTVGSRANQIKSFEFNGEFIDVQFLCKYLEIDGLDLCLNYSQISLEDKQIVLEYAKANVFDFVKNTLDYQDLDTEYEDLNNEIDKNYYAIDLKRLKEIKYNLLSDTRAKEFPTVEEAAVDYVNEIYRHKQYLQISR
jgi:hypothetical protein